MLVGGSGGHCFFGVVLSLGMVMSLDLSLQAQCKLLFIVLTFDWFCKLLGKRIERRHLEIFEIAEIIPLRNVVSAL